MTQPLALVLYERLLPGRQLVNRLQDLKYRVQTLSDPAFLVQAAEESKPMLVLVDLEPATAVVCGAVSRLKRNPATQHLPVLAYSSDQSELEAEARDAGATLSVRDSAVLNHLPQLLEQALQVE